MGNPLEESTQVGPITTRPQYKKVLDYIEIAKQQGAQVMLGGGPASRAECGDGWFVEPTVFAAVTPDMRIAQEEVFGPVLAVMPFESDDEAVEIANGSMYGLAAASQTRNSRLKCAAFAFSSAASKMGQTRKAAPRSCNFMSATVGAQRFGVSLR